MLDVFKRLHGTSEDFFTPHDFEVTYAELAYICDKARKWTHPRGTVALTTHRTTRQLVNRQLIVNASLSCFLQARGAASPCATTS